MAIFDPDLQRIVVRVVYDGPALAGKTTNVEQLCTFFSSQRRSELFVPQRIGQRTLYFDWMHLDGGLVDGRSLRCQFVTVPGQRVLEERRSRIVDTADVIVFVCDSTPNGVECAHEMLTAVDRQSSERLATLPLIVQANKQDLPGALSSEQIREALGLASSISLTRAIAREGVGVRETAVLAVRAAANHVQRQLTEGGLDGITGRATGGEALYRELLAIEEAAREAERVSVQVSPSQPLVNDVTQPAANDSPAPVERTLNGRMKQSLAEQTYGPLYPRERPASKQERIDAPDDARTTTPVAATRARPVFPSPEVPSGYIWPALDGRATLAKVDTASAEPVVDPRRSSAPPAEDAPIVFRAGAWRLATSARHRYDSAAEARMALLEVVRIECRLKRLSPTGTVVSLQPAADGSHWLWRIAPWLTPIDRTLTLAAAASDATAISRGLERFADALVASVELAVRDALVLDLAASAFAEQASRVVYLSKAIGVGRELPMFGSAFVDRADAFSTWPDAVSHYAASTVRGLEHLAREVALSPTGIFDSLRRATASTRAGATARQHVLEAFAHIGGVR